MSNLLQGLNDIQYDAVTDIEGHKLILAGAGSGKTKVVTTKIAYLIDNGVSPFSILGFTFTNKAANEMKDRIDRLVSFNVDKMWIGTFHSICVRILRHNIAKIGYSQNFTILDTSDQKTVYKEIIKEFNFDEKIYTPKSLQSEISNLKNSYISPEEYEKSIYTPRDKAISRIYYRYNEKLKHNNSVDFDDLILLTVKLLTDNIDIMEYYHDRFKYIFVDEFQDTNNIQYELIKLLTGPDSFLNVVGDSDQSIYKFRGANIENILNFNKDFKNSRQIILNENYRSTKNILKTANNVIENNDNRIKKEQWTGNKEGDKPLFFTADSSREEAEFVSNKIEEYIQNGINPSEIAILYRSNYLSRSFEESLMRKNISYKVVGGIKFYERAEIKDLIAYLRLISNSNDDISFLRVVNSPKRGIGNATIEKLNYVSNEMNLSLFESINYLRTFNILGNTAINKLEDFRDLINSLKVDRDNMNIEILLRSIIDKTEYIELLESQKTLESKSRIENIEEFIGSIITYEENNESNLEAYLSDISLLSDVDKTEELDNSITLITVHSAKGLEYQVVFLVGLSEGIFPSSFVESDEDLEEERRLMYVAITRAKENLHLTRAINVDKFGKSTIQIESSFIQEMGDSIEIIENEKKKFFNPRESSFTKFNNYNNFRNGNSYRKAEEPVVINKNNNIYKEGQEVSHEKWGRGTVTKVDNSANDTIITVVFNDGNRKTLMADLAPMEVISE